MQRGQQPQQGEPDDPRRGNSSHPPDLNGAQISNAEKLEKDLKRSHDEPLQQHRSSRRPRSKPQHH